MGVANCISSHPSKAFSVELVYYGDGGTLCHSSPPIRWQHERVAKIIDSKKITALSPVTYPESSR